MCVCVEMKLEWIKIFGNNNSWYVVCKCELWVVSVWYQIVEWSVYFWINRIFFVGSSCVFGMFYILFLFVLFTYLVESNRVFWWNFHKWYIGKVSFSLSYTFCCCSGLRCNSFSIHSMKNGLHKLFHSKQSQEIFRSKQILLIDLYRACMFESNHLYTIRVHTKCVGVLFAQPNENIHFAYHCPIFKPQNSFVFWGVCVYFSSWILLEVIKKSINQ